MTTSSGKKCLIRQRPNIGWNPLESHVDITFHLYGTYTFPWNYGRQTLKFCQELETLTHGESPVETGDLHWPRPTWIPRGNYETMEGRQEPLEEKDLLNHRKATFAETHSNPTWTLDPAHTMEKHEMQTLEISAKNLRHNHSPGKKLLNQKSTIDNPLQLAHQFSQSLQRLEGSEPSSAT